MPGPKVAWSDARWAVPLSASLLGLALTAAGVVALGLGISFLANSVLLYRAHQSRARRFELASWSRTLARRAVMVGSGVVLLGAAFLDSDPWGPSRRILIVAMTSGAQLYLIGRSIDPTHDANRRSRLLLPLLGHAVILLASSLLLWRQAMPETTVALGYFTGFTMVLLHAYWVDLNWEGRGSRERATGLELTFLAALGVSLTLLAIDSSVGIAARLGDSRLTELVGRGGFVVALALLADPPVAKQGSGVTPGGVRQFLSQALVVVLLLNALILAVFLISGGLAFALYVILTAWLSFAVAFEYVASGYGVLRARRNRRSPRKTPPDPTEPITVLVSALNDAEVLKRATTKNLALALPLEFLLVASANSKDDTVAVARQLAQDHPGRVRVLEARASSKAEDLNEAWPQVRTALVLLLDADEVIDEDALAWGVDLLEREPKVGIVQGRKASSGETDTWTGRFAMAERRFSTIIDQSAQSDLFGAAHFAGSVALVRREVPMSVGGWSPVTLTEDIEFTMRIHIANRWHIVYEPRMVAEESDPVTFRALVRQRVRWARGWGEVYSLHFTHVLAAAGKIGPWRTTGLTWQLITSISAPWSIFLPALGLLALTGGTPGLPMLAGLTLAILILPSRLIAFAMAALLDPRIPTRRARVREAVYGALAGYGWILFGWLIQLHALYLEVSAAPRTWYGTRKSAAAPADASLA